ncbi:restriction endonuclease [Longimicrobium terrae]|uniref:Restriction system protein n=1 Tax=Longimicrobium terrae TaxID=1639882 RepID=A0A841GZ10_9BACT|nr:restriction endonuclease [Longimicrobium terrae]MBB4636476.1 restriction system protein [Longimicrobium terrae]MBB6071000.1 restriction system protein [Longimicrobium terrae]NNC29022.1 restriction endonuclease [Longimicrobium terrae]
MALWLVRAGKYGEHEARFLNENRVYLTWDDLSYDLSALRDRGELDAVLQATYTDAKVGTLRNFAAQIWSFSHRMSQGDWVVVPSKSKPVFNIAEITGAYAFHSQAENPYYHSRPVRWVARDVPRAAVPQDLRYSLGAIMTICKIERNDAERRIRELQAIGWNVESAVRSAGPSDIADPDEDVDLEQLARDQIAALITQRFKGHALERLVEAVLKAQGYVTYHSPKGPDKGVDLLAAPGPLGFGTPRICVQVKSGDTPVDRPTLDQLVGTMQNVHAEQGLLVSWGGFNRNVEKEVPQQFFRVRMWNQVDLIAQVLEHYDKFDEEIRAELPLKRIWTVAGPEED